MLLLIVIVRTESETGCPIEDSQSSVVLSPVNGVCPELPITRPLAVFLLLKESLSQATPG